MKKLLDIDCIGMCASALCLIHCLCLPWLVAIAGVYFGAFFESPNFHNIMLVVAIIIGLPVFILSFMKYKSKLILITGVVGLSLTTFGTIKSDNCCPTASTEETCSETSECTEVCSDTDVTECSEVCSEEAEGECQVVNQEEESGIVTAQGFNTVPLGVSLLVFAHFLNFRKRKRCKKSCCD